MGIVNTKLVSSMLNYDIEKKGKYQRYMGTEIVSIIYIYKGILFTINCDKFQQFKVYDENTETCYLLDASTLCGLDNDGNLKLIVKDNVDHIYGNISYATIVHVDAVKLAEPVEIYSILEGDLTLYIENYNKDLESHYIEYINLYMAEEFIEDITINGTTTHRCKFENVKPGKVIYKEFLYAHPYNFDDELLELRPYGDKYIVKKVWHYADIEIENLIHASGEKLDTNDIRIKSALIEYMMTNKAYGCTIKDDNIHFRSNDITLEIVSFDYISYVYRITGDEPIPNEGYTENNLYFERINVNEDLFIVVPISRRFKYYDK